MPFKENIAKTRTVVEYAHTHGVPVEGELGTIGGTDVNIPLLKEINAVVDVPLVIHGGTGVKEEDYPELINNGIRKFNVGTELLVNWNKEAKDCFSTTELNKSLRHNVIPANMKVKEIVKHKIGLFMNVDSPLKIG